MKLKHIPVGTVFAVIMLLFIIISGLAFATKTASAASTSPNSASSDVEVRADLVPGGKSVDQLEFWQADEFEIWMEQQHEENQRLADNHDKSFYDKDANGDYYCREWTQEDVDTLYDQWHEQLDLMKEGYQFTSKFLLMMRAGFYTGSQQCSKIPTPKAETILYDLLSPH